MAAGTRREFLRFAVNAGAAALLLTPLPSVEATVPACGNVQPPVHVDTSLPEPILDNSQPQRAIQSLAPGYHGGRTIGLYSAEVEARIQTHFRSVGVKGASLACLFVTGVDVDIVMPKRRIYVSSELWPGTCPHTAVLEHERKHEATDDRAIRIHAPRIRQAIQDALKQVPAQVSAEEHDAAQRRVDRVIRSAFDKAWVAFIADRSDLQRQVDAGLEYARVAASCPDWSPIRQ